MMKYLTLRASTSTAENIVLRETLQLWKNFRVVWPLALHWKNLAVNEPGLQIQNLWPWLPPHEPYLAMVSGICTAQRPGNHSNLEKNAFGVKRCCPISGGGYNQTVPTFSYFVPEAPKIPFLTSRQGSKHKYSAVFCSKLGWSPL